VKEPRPPIRGGEGPLTPDAPVPRAH
jgi:hypothetical protein